MRLVTRHESINADETLRLAKREGSWRFESIQNSSIVMKPDSPYHHAAIKALASKQPFKTKAAALTALQTINQSGTVPALNSDFHCENYYDAVDYPLYFVKLWEFNQKPSQGYWKASTELEESIDKAWEYEEHSDFNQVFYDAQFPTLQAARAAVEDYIANMQL